MKMISIVITFFLIVKCSWCLPLDQFYPFGANENDQMLDSLPGFVFTNFFFDTFSRQEIYIQRNGIITFTSPDLTSTSMPTPLPIQDLDLIAPYWFDDLLLDTCNDSFNFNESSALNSTFPFNETFSGDEASGSVPDDTCSSRYSSTVYYRNSFSFSLQERATREIRAAFFGATINFFVRRLLIITWVITETKDDLSEPEDNIFQCVIANDGISSYVIFNYADGLSELTDESNAVPVQAGINAAFRPTANFISIPNTSNISVTSNVGIPGVWMFQTDTRPFTTPFPPVNVTINATDEQTVGLPFTMECRVGPAMDIDNTFDVVWNRGFNNEVRRVNNIPGSLLSFYSDFFTIPILTAIDAFSRYRCEVIVNFDQPGRVGFADFTLDNVSQTPQLIISPMQSPLRVKVGGHLPIYCTAVRGVPVPQIQWHSEGIPVYPSTSFYQQIYVVPTDSPRTTTYTCVGTTFAGGIGVISEITVNVTVVVEEPCPRLQAPRRGEITITEDGQLAFFSCNRGYTIRGSNVLKCRNGYWDSSPPTCNFINPFCRIKCNL